MNPRRKDLPWGGKPRSPTWVFHLSAPSALTYAGAERKNAQPSFAVAVKQWSQRWIPWMFRKNRLRLWYYLQLSAFWELATGLFGAVLFSCRIRLIFALPNSQGGKDQTLKHHLNKLQQEPEPPSRGLLPHFTVLLGVWWRSPLKYTWISCLGVKRFLDRTVDGTSSSGNLMTTSAWKNKENFLFLFF